MTHGIFHNSSAQLDLRLWSGSWNSSFTLSQFRRDLLFLKGIKQKSPCILANLAAISSIQVLIDAIVRFEWCNLKSPQLFSLNSTRSSDSHRLFFRRRISLKLSPALPPSWNRIHTGSRLSQYFLSSSRSHERSSHTVWHTYPANATPFIVLNALLVVGLLINYIFLEYAQVPN